MKTLQIRTQNQVIHTINVKQITHFRTADNEKGTYVYLSCGNYLHTLLSVKDLLGMIERCGKEDLED
jgi:hypothetical protein